MVARNCNVAELIPTAEVARMVGRTIATVNRWANEGRLPIAAQAGGRVFHRDDVLALIAELEAEAQERARAARAAEEAAAAELERLRAARS